MTTYNNGLSAAVAATLSGERVAARMSFDDLAASSGIPARSLKRYLSGERDMKVDTIDSIAKAMGLTLGEVFTAAERRRARMSSSDTPGARDSTGNHVTN